MVAQIKAAECQTARNPVARVAEHLLELARRVTPGAVAAVFALTLAFSAAPVLAHGGGESGDGEGDACAQLVGNRYMMHMGAYQPDTGGYEEFCRDIPATGETILVFDLMDGALYALPIALKVVEAGGDADGATVVDIPAKTYPTGVIEANINLPAAGEYAAIITIEEGTEQPIVSRFRIRVGGQGGTGSASFVIIALALLAIGGGVYYMRSKKVQKTA